MKNALLIITLLVCSISFGQEKFNAEEVKISTLIEGTLLVPDLERPQPLAIIIAGSGPTTRDGNQQMMVNNNLKLLAEGLYENSIATFRYDKRLVKMMKLGRVVEEKINFDDFVKDANEVLALFKKDKRFSKIYIIGHSQGSLIGMLTAQNGADGLVSIAGAGQSIDAVIIDQLEKQAPGLKDNAIQSFAEMRKTGQTKTYSDGLSSIFRPSLQPFMNSWMKYNPQTEIAKLKVPVLIVNGTKDLQVQISEAELLQKAKPDAQYLLIDKMNHIFKQVDGSDMENQKTYNLYNLPVMPQLISAVSEFIKK